MRISNKLRSFFIVLLSIVVVMAALPLQALKVSAATTVNVEANDVSMGVVWIGDDTTVTSGDFEGESITVHAKPNDGYVFMHFKDNTTTYQNTISTTTVDKVITLDGTTTHDITAVFAAACDFTAEANNPNGGEVAITGDYNGGKSYNGGRVSLSAIVNSGYKFTGWKISGNDSVISTDNPYIATVTGDSSYIACFEQGSVTITFDPNDPDGKDVSNTMDSQEIPYNSSENLASNVYECSGDDYYYDFDGWTWTNGSTTTHYDNGASITVGVEDITLYAQWIKCVPITLNSNYTDGPTSEVWAREGRNYTAPDLDVVPDFVRDGYRLKGWGINDPSPAESDIVAPEATIAGANIQEGLTLYAQWEKVYTISYNANGGQGSIQDGVFAVGDGGTAAGTIADPGTAITRTGYEFAGWNAKEDGSGNEYVTGDVTLTEDITLYAQWNRVITLHANDGSEPDITTKQYAPVGQESSIKSIQDTAFQSPAGMEFFGWTTTSGGKVIEYADGASITITGDNSKDIKDLYAQWAVPVTITFDSNDSAYYGNAAGSMSAIKVGKGLQFTLPANGYTLAGHNFSGWKDVQGVTITKSGDDYIIVIDSDYSGTSLTLYAQWDVTEHTVSFIDWDDSSVDSSNVPYGVKPSHSALTREDTTEHTYEFAGWENTATNERYTGELPEVTGPVTYKAYYAEYNRQYTVTAAVSPAEAGTVTVGANDRYSETANISVEPAFGYHVQGWTNNGVNADEDGTSYEFIVSGDHNVVVYLENNPHTVNVTTSGGGDVAIEAEAPEKIVYGDVVRVIATQASGYHFVNWVDAEGNVVSTDSTFEFTVTADYSYKAVFELNSYAIGVTSEAHGSVSGAGTYNHFDTCTIAAIPDTGYEFAGWKDPVTGNIVVDATQPSYSFTVEGSRDFVATFRIKNYSISLIVPKDNNDKTHGKVFGGGSFDHFTSITVTATPDEGYRFVCWVENGTNVSSDANYTFTVTSNRKLEAVFEVNMYTVTYKDDDGTILQQSEFAWGTNAYFQKATPTKAPTAQYTYKFAGWDNKVTRVTGDVTYTAVYDKTINQYTVKFVNADGKVLQEGLVDYGEMPSFNGETPVKPATVEYTYTFAGWDKELSKVQGDVTYTATYTEKKFEKGDIDYVYFKVVFNSNGGSEVVTQLVQDGYTASKPDDPMRERYNFAGWYIDEELTKPFSFSTVITADITLYAKWVKGVQEVEVTYAVVGDGTIKWQSGSSEGVDIVIERSQDNDKASDHFKSIQINGEDIAYFNYSITEGSATITLSVDALRDLTPGTYKVTILFDDGQAEVDLIVEGEQKSTDGVTETPETAAGDPAGDNTTSAPATNYLGLWIALGVVALVCVAAAPILIIKRRGVK